MALHVCRHTFCTNMSRLGMNPKMLQYIIGHADISVTSRIYIHAIQSAEAQAAETLRNILPLPCGRLCHHLKPRRHAVCEVFAFRA